MPVRSVALPLAMILTGSTAGFAAGLEAWRAHDVQVEILPVHVNGLPLVIHRAVGSGVSQLVEGMDRQWVKESGKVGVRSAAQGDWVVRSRMRHGSLEVLQWRGSGPDAEALWSSSSPGTSVQVPPRAELELPIGCVIGRTVHGNVDATAYLQQTARCNSSARATLTTLGTSASRKGYAVQSREALLVARGKAYEVTVLAWDRGRSGAPGDASLVYMQVQRKGSAP